MEGTGGASAEGGTAPGSGAEGRVGMKRLPAPTRREAVDGVARELAGAGEEAAVDQPRVEAQRLLCHVLGADRAELARTGDVELSPEEAGRLARVTRRRLAGEPLQHIEGTTEFRELVLLADERALIPRPETEELVDRIEAWARAREGAEGGVRRVSRRGGRDEALLGEALDVGTGSGAIALSLVAEGIAGRAVGLDVSTDALLQAAANRSGAGLSEDEVEFRVAARPVWNSVSRDERFDVVVSNPPYLTDEEMAELPAQIAEHEPADALAGGRDGLDVVREIVDRAGAYLRPGGALFLEIGAGQGEAVRELLGASGGWSEVEVERDLAGRERFVRAERPEGGGEG
jgi:release factor glutamine methyltransferase